MLGLVLAGCLGVAGCACFVAAWLAAPAWLAVAILAVAGTACSAVGVTFLADARSAW